VKDRVPAAGVGWWNLLSKVLSKPQNKRTEALFHFASRKSIPDLEGLQDVLAEQLLVSVGARFVIVPVDVICDCSDYDVGNLERLNVARVAEGCSLTAQFW
jgi:hypothetical protein